ncbi:MAG: response regulator [Myxococcales bacterium]|nr:response regulator [Myxococcales bacterium]
MSEASPDLESERLAALAELALLDRAPEPAFDAITQLTARLLDVPVAMVSLVDRDQLWIKSSSGAAPESVPRAASFCDHVVRSRGPVVIENTLVDPRSADHPAVLEAPRLRFYSGQPLVTESGHIVGTLCVVDFQPRHWRQSDHETLSLLTAQVNELLALRAHRQRLVRVQVDRLDRERQLRSVLDEMSEGMVLHDASGAIVDANRAAEVILGLDRTTLIGRRPADPRWRAVHEDGSPFMAETHPAAEVLRTRKPVSGVVMGVHRPDDTLRWISITALPIAPRDVGSGLAVLSTFRDITTERAIQATSERLARQERLVTAGTLAAGLGHEINNPLSFVSANIEVALQVLRVLGPSLPRHAELVEALTDALDGAERVRKIVKGLRTLAREGGAPVPTHLASAIEASIQIAMHALRPRARVETRLDPTPLAMADESSVAQIVINLLVNAAECFHAADPSRNLVTVESGVADDGRVFVRVRDNGPGMTAAQVERVFEPFYTTKANGQGTGLGLPISQSLAQQLGGTLTVRSEPGQGTQFTLSFQPVAAPASEKRAAPRVLLVDDEEGVLRALSRALREQFEVVAESDSRVALRRIASGEHFDVIFCDLMMPHLGGVELYAEVARLRPPLVAKMVFMTGGTTNERTAGFLATVANDRLEKPFSMQTLRPHAHRIAATGPSGEAQKASADTVRATS